MKPDLAVMAHMMNRNRRLHAFTLIEVIFAMATMVILVLALLSAQFIGLRLDQVVESKQGASDSSRKVINQLPLDIKSSKMWNIGNISGTNVVLIAGGTPQQGTALQLFQTTNASQFILYYFDQSDAINSDGKLMRTTSSSWNPVVIASNLINSLYFTAENYNGVVATNDGSGMAYRNVIHTTLQFCQFEYPQTIVGTNGLYDYYKMDFKATPHLPE
jgi:type II secretory pathway pseudopilin PulG